MVGRYFKIYTTLAKSVLQHELEFRFNLVVRVWSEIMWLIVSVVFIKVVFGQVDSIAGYSEEEVLLIYALAKVVVNFLAIFVIDNIRELPYYINQGQLDMMLSKPVNLLFLVVANGTNLTRFVGQATVIVFFIYSLGQVDIELTLIKLLLIGFVLVLLSLIYTSLLLCFFISSVWLGDIAHGYWIFDELLVLFRLPAEAFSGGWKVIFSYIVPAVLFGAVPVAILLDRFDAKDLVYFLVAAVVWVTLAYFFWHKALASYTSAGG